MCCLVLRSNCALLLTIQYASLISSLIYIISLLLTTLEFFIFGGSLLGLVFIISDPRRGCYMALSMFIFFLLFSFFSATILSGPYLWSRYSQRLQIECAAWSCGLVLHCCLPSNSLRYFYFLFFLFFRQNFVPAIYLEPLLAETPNSVCCLVLRFSCALLFIIQFALLFFFFFSATILSGPYLWNHYSQRLQIECAAWSSSLILHCRLPSNSFCYFFKKNFFRHDFVWRRVFHLWGIAPRSNTGRPRTFLVIIIIIISDPRSYY